MDPNPCNTCGRHEGGEGGKGRQMLKKRNNKSNAQCHRGSSISTFSSLSFAILHNSLGCLTVRMLYFFYNPPSLSLALSLPLFPFVCAVSLLISSRFSLPPRGSQFNSAFICIFTYFLMQFNYFISNPN